MFEEITQYQCRSRAVPILQLTIAAERIAAANGLALQAWTEDGLGPHEGFMIKLDSGPVLGLHSSCERLDLGTTVEADLADLTEQSLPQLIACVLSILGIAEDQVLWRQEATNLEQGAHGA